MGSKKSIILVIFLLVSVFSLNSFSNIAKNDYQELIREMNYVDHEPIIIITDNNTFIRYRMVIIVSKTKRIVQEQVKKEIEQARFKAALLIGT